MMNPIKQKLIEIYGKEPETMDELAECVIARARRDYSIVGFAWKLTYYESIETTHCAPHGENTTFSVRDRANLPKFSEWHGRMWLRVDKRPRTFGSSILQNTLTHVGTGGQGAHDGPWYAIYLLSVNDKPKNGEHAPICYGWDYKLFHADWPLIGEMVEKELAWSVLLGEPQPKRLTHDFIWNEEETARQDDRFLASALFCGVRLPIELNR